MNYKPNLLLLRLWPAVIAMLAGLAGLGFVVHSATVELDGVTRTIVEDTVPSIMAIESMNVSFSRLRQALRAHLEAPGEPAVAAAVVGAELRALHDHAAVYLALPIDRGEAEIMDDLRRSLGHLDEIAGRVVATAVDTPSGSRRVLQGELDAAAAEFANALVRASTLNADLTYQSTRTLRAAGKLLLPSAVVLEIASAVAAVIAIGAAYELNRHEGERAERTLLETKNAELEAFSARVAHDLLSPLLTVSLALGLAEQRLTSPADEGARRAVARATTVLHRVRQMVVDLLGFARAAARPPPGVKTRVLPVLRGLMEDMEPVATAAGVELRLQGESQRSVACAAGVLSCVLSNLVQNAIRHTKQQPERRVEVRVVDAGDDVRFEVADTGPGIDPKDRDVIFEPFVSRSDEGSGLGLGLATVKRLAESHSGRVGVDTTKGVGALFWVTLPAAA